MPTVTLPDGTNVFIDSNDPKEIERQKENYRKEKLSRASGSSTLGDIARAVPAAGVSAVQGIVTAPTTGIDLLFNTEVTDSVNDGFMRDYMDERYGDNLDIDINTIKNIDDEENVKEDMQLGRTKVLESEQIMMPDIPSMGGEDVAQASTVAQGPAPANLNADQRVALAGGDLDEAIALRNRT